MYSYHVIGIPYIYACDFCRFCCIVCALLEILVFTTGDEGGIPSKAMMAFCVGRIEEFDASIDNWRSYVQWLEHYFKAHKINYSL